MYTILGIGLIMAKKVCDNTSIFKSFLIAEYGELYAYN